MPLLPEAQQAIQAALDALEIDGLPSNVQAGEKVTPRLRPDPLQALRPLALGERTLASIKLPLENLTVPITLPTEIPVILPIKVPINLGANLDQINLDTTGTAPGDADAEVVMKAVQFDRPALRSDGSLDTAPAATGELPYLVPTGIDSTGLPTYTLNDKVQGFLGKVSGLIKQIQGLTGSILGTVGGTIGSDNTALTATLTIPNAPDRITIPSLLGAITTPQLLPKEPTVTVKWTVEDDSGNALKDEQFVLKPAATDPAPSIVFLPEFVEMTRVGVTSSKRRVFCEVTVSVEVGTLPGGDPDIESFPRKLGPFSIDVPKIPVPTVLAMTQHSKDDKDLAFPGGVLIAVPATSMIQGLDQLRTLLDPVRSTLGRLRAAASLIGKPTFGEAAGYLDQLLGLLDTADPKPPAFRQQDSLPNLDDVTLRPGVFLGFGRESFEDKISALLMVGPPRRSVRVYRQRDFNTDTAGGDRGVFDLVVGPTAVAFVKTLEREQATDPIACVPEGSQFRELVQPAENGRWNDRISSYQFLPLSGL